MISRDRASDVAPFELMHRLVIDREGGAQYPNLPRHSKVVDPARFELATYPFEGAALSS
jgi:hypothetical protein